MFRREGRGRFEPESGDRVFPCVVLKRRGGNVGSHSLLLSDFVFSWSLVCALGGKKGSDGALDILSLVSVLGSRERRGGQGRVDEKNGERGHLL